MACRPALPGSTTPALISREMKHISLSRIVPTLRVLLAEDVAPDAELEVRELKRAGLRVSHRIVDSEKDFIRALREFAPGVILSDFSMPQFDGMEALRLAKELAPDTPFIFVSGTLGEEYAIRALKNGATDYVVKSNLVRLSAAVERALAEAKLLRERRQTETELEIARERLQEREAGLRRAQIMAKLAHVITGLDGTFESWSDTLPGLIGMQPASMPRSTREWLDIMHPEDREALRAKSIEAGATGKRVEVEYRLRRDGAEWIHVRQVIEPLGGRPEAGGSERWFSTLQDVTEQKRAEERIKRLNRVYAVLSGINGLIVRVRDRDELFREACRLAVEAGKFGMAWIGLVDREAMSVKPVAWHGTDAEYIRLMPLGLVDTGPQGRGLAGRAVRERTAITIDDMTQDPRILLRKEALERGFRSLVMLPLMVAEEPVGVLALYAGEINGSMTRERNPRSRASFLNRMRGSCVISSMVIAVRSLTARPAKPRPWGPVSTSPNGIKRMYSASVPCQATGFTDIASRSTSPIQAMPNFPASTASLQASLNSSSRSRTRTISPLIPDSTAYTRLRRLILSSARFCSVMSCSVLNHRSLPPASGRPPSGSITCRT